MFLRAVAVLSILATSTATLADGLAAKDRELALHDLERTREKFLKSVAGLSEAQWTFKAAPDRWSIAETAEHIATAETAIGGQFSQAVLKAPASPERRAEIKVSDEQILRGVTDRTRKFKAPDVLQPTGRFASRDATVRAYQSARADTIEMVSNTKEHLRSRVTPHPAFGAIDGVQFLLFLAAHSERHTLQIEEVKTAPGYPK
jgi:predicted metal-dependent phosphoesterase TrpH